MSLDTAQLHQLRTSEAAERARGYWPPPQGRWTYADYARLADVGFRYEVIQGDLYMSPAPRPRHQRVVKRLAHRLDTFLESQPLGEVFISPIDVILPDLADPVQPDLVFVSADRVHIVSEARIEAPPDLIVEVLSSRTAARDRTLKFDVHARAGVREYWIIDPEPDARTIEVYVLRGDAYALAATFGPGDVTRSEVLPGCALPVDDVCAG
jgi:Uma2 family endonuclease